MKIYVSIRLEGFATDVNIDTELNTFFQDLATTHQEEFTFNLAENKAKNHLSFETSVNFCCATLLKGLNKIIQTCDSEKKENLNNCVWFKYKIETSKVEKPEANFDQFVSYITGIQSIKNI